MMVGKKTLAHPTKIRKLDCHEIISRYVESNLTGFQNLSGLVVELISCTFLIIWLYKKLEHQVIMFNILLSTFF